MQLSSMAGGRLPPLRERYCNRLTVGADSIRPLNPAGRRRYAGAIEGIKRADVGIGPYIVDIDSILLVADF